MVGVVVGILNSSHSLDATLMHCRAPCLRPGNTFIFSRLSSLYFSFDQVRWARVKNNCLLHTKAKDFKKESSALGCWESHEQQTDKTNAVVKTRLEDTTDIYVNDLSATLEAHREKNRASIIRKVRFLPELDYDLPYKRLACLTSRKDPRVNEFENAAVLGNSSSVDSHHRSGGQQTLASEIDGDKSAGVDGANNTL